MTKSNSDMLKKLHFYVSFWPQSFSSGLISAAVKLTELPGEQLKSFWATGKGRQLVFKLVLLHISLL